MADNLFLNLLVLYLFIALGVIIGRISKDNRQKINKYLTEILMKIISPLQIYLTLVCTQFEITFLFVIQIVLLAIGLYFSLIAISYIILKKKKVDPKKMGSYLLLNAMPNVLFYTIPIVIAVFPEELTIVVVLFASTMLIIRGSIAMYISQRLGADVKPNWKEAITNLLKFPPFIAIILASISISFTQFLPMAFFNLIKSPVSTVASDLSAVVIGMILATLNLTEIKKYGKDIGAVALFRFGLSLIYYMIIVYFLSFPVYQTEIRTILLIVCMGPPAVYNVVFAVYFHLEEKFAAISVATITLIALILLPLLILIGPAIF